MIAIKRIYNGSNASGFAGSAKNRHAASWLVGRGHLMLGSRSRAHCPSE